MAFNPFEVFSVRSKIGRSIMAVLGIIVMLTFVLSTGAVGSGNDFFDVVTGLFQSKGSGIVVAEAYGDKIKSSDLAEVRQQRIAANAFLEAAAAVSTNNLATDLSEKAKGERLSAEVRRQLQEILSVRSKATTDQLSARIYGSILRNDRMIQQLFDVRQRAKEGSEDRQALDDLVAIMSFDMMGYVRPVPEIGTDSDADDINFLLLLKKADQLGIKYSPEVIRELLSRDTNGRLLSKDAAEIESKLRDSRMQGAKFTSEWLLNAVGNEFRARAAIKAQLGQSVARQKAGGPLSAFPGAVTPYQFFEFYKDQCSEHAFEAIAVSADKFKSKVAGEPTTKERVELFNKYRNDLPDPTRDRPAFKEPRKVKVEFVTLDANAKRITDALPAVEAASLFLSITAGAQTFNCGPAAALAQAAHPELARVLPAKVELAKRVEDQQRPYQPIDWFIPNVRDVSVCRPEVLASLVAGLSGFPAPMSAYPATAMSFRLAEVHDHKHRAPFLLQAWLMPFNPVATNAFGLPAFALPHLIAAPPESLYAKTVANDLKADQRRKLFEADIQALQEKLRTINQDVRFAEKADKAKTEKALAESKTYMNEWLAARKLTASGSAGLRTKQEIATDPALKPLNDLATIPDAGGANSLAEQIFSVFDQPGLPAPIPLKSVYGPEWFPAPPAGEFLDKPNLLYWTSEDVASETFRTLTAADEALAKIAASGPVERWLVRGGWKSKQMTERVDDAWKLEKAKLLARAEADKLLEKVKEISKTTASNPDGVAKQLRDLAAAQKFEVVRLDGLAKLKFQHGTTPNQMGYSPSKIDPRRVPNAGESFGDAILEVRGQGLGATVIVPDAPKSTYYVAVMTGRDEKTIEQFQDVFGKSAAFGFGRNELYERHALPIERAAAFRGMFDRLKAEAGYKETEEYKKRENQDQ